MLNENLRSPPSVSVSYGTVDIGLYSLEGNEIRYASLDRAGKVIAQLPQEKRTILLAPIEQGLLDPQSVFFLIDDKSEGQIAICVEDFVQLINHCFADEANKNQKQEKICEEISHSQVIDGESSPIPPRLLHALSLVSDKGYSSIDDDGSGGYLSYDGQSRSRGESSGAYSGGDYDYVPSLPESRPPAVSFSLSNSSVGPNDQLNADAEDANSWKTAGLANETTARKPSVLESESGKHRAETSDCASQLSLSQKLSVNSSNSNTSALNESNKSKRRQHENIIFQVSLRHHPVRVACLAVGILMLLGGIAVGTYLLLHRLSSKEATTTNIPTSPYITRNETHDCVNGSTLKVLLDFEMIQLVDLQLPEKQPTLIVQSREYLFIPNKTQWFFARRYCTAWCGSLVAIKNQEEDQMILEMIRNQLPQGFSNYWIGTKGWKGSWHMDDESNVTYFNFLDQGLANQSIASEDYDGGCTQVNASGIWSLVLCNAMNPFICERNTADIIKRTPFYPHQEVQCANRGGHCKYEKDCTDGKTIRNLCPLQANDVLCCMQNKEMLSPLKNSSIKSCADAGGICNHVEMDECRNGKVIFDLSTPCPDQPRKLDCCVENDEF